MAAFKRFNNGNEGQSIGLFTDSLMIVEGVEYALGQRNTIGLASALYSYYKREPGIIQDFETTSFYNGSLRLTRLDTIHQIASGTFWFKAVNNVGDTVSITNGRFDVRYTR